MVITVVTGDVDDGCGDGDDVDTDSDHGRDDAAGGVVVIVV